MVTHSHVSVRPISIASRHIQYSPSLTRIILLMSNLLTGSRSTRPAAFTRRNYEILPTNERLRHLKRVKKREEKCIVSACQFLAVCSSLAIFLVFATFFVHKTSWWILLVIRLVGVGNAVCFTGLAIVVIIFTLKCDIIQRDIDGIENQLASEQADASRLRAELDYLFNFGEENRQMSEKMKRLRADMDKLFAMNNLLRYIPILPSNCWSNKLHSNNTYIDSTELEPRKYCCDGSSSKTTPQTGSLTSGHELEGSSESSLISNVLGGGYFRNFGGNESVRAAFYASPQGSSHNLQSLNEDIASNDQSNKEMDAFSYQEALLSARLSRMVDELVGEDPSYKGEAASETIERLLKTEHHKIKTKNQIEHDKQLDESTINNITLNNPSKLGDDDVHGGSQRHTVDGPGKPESHKFPSGGKDLVPNETKFSPPPTSDSGSTVINPAPRRKGGPFEYYVCLNLLNTESEQNLFDCLNDPPNDFRLRSVGRQQNFISDEVVFPDT